MKFNFFIATLAVSSGLLGGCEKNNTQPQQSASIRIINALIGGGDVKLNTNERDSVLMFNTNVFTLAINDNQASVQVWPSTRKDKPYYNNTLNAQSGDTYSLFLFGLPGSMESLLIKENIPAWYMDSVMGIRVAHCVPGSGPVNIFLKSNPATPEFRQIRYKMISDIVKIPLPGIISAEATSFEVRDAVDGKLLATYDLPVDPNFLYPEISVALQRFKNITLVIKGSRDTLSGSNTFDVFPTALSY